MHFVVRIWLLYFTVCQRDILNWKDVQRKNVVNNVNMSSLRAPWQLENTSNFNELLLF